MAKKELPLIVTGGKPLTVPNFSDDAEYAAAEAVLDSLKRTGDVGKQIDKLERIRRRLENDFRSKLLPVLKDMALVAVELWGQAIQACADIAKLRSQLESKGYSWPLDTDLMVPGALGINEGAGGRFTSFCLPLARWGSTKVPAGGSLPFACPWRVTDS